MQKIKLIIFRDLGLGFSYFIIVLYITTLSEQVRNRKVILIIVSVCLFSFFIVVNICTIILW